MRRFDEIIDRLQDLELPWKYHQEDAEWLIARVKRLETALNKIEKSYFDDNGPWTREVAREALSEDSDEK